MKFLAIDYGQKRVGLAISDDSETFALPFDTRENGGKASTQRLLKSLLETIRTHDIEAIVAGLPKESSGAESAMEIETRAFVEELKNALTKADLEREVLWWDERFSTASVLKNLRAAGISQKKAREAEGALSTDARAAATILQDFLDARKLRASWDSDQNAVHNTDHSEDIF